MNYTKNKFIFYSLLLASFSSCGQITNHNKMTVTTIELVNDLKNVTHLAFWSYWIHPLHLPISRIIEDL